MVDAQDAIGRFNRTVDAVDGQLMHAMLARVYAHAGRKDDAVAELQGAMQIPVAVTAHVCDSIRPGTSYAAIQRSSGSSGSEAQASDLL